MKRRTFLRNISLLGAGISSAQFVPAQTNNSKTQINKAKKKPVLPVIVATWNVKDPVEVASKVLEENGSALDAVEQGCRSEEANASNQTVGIGGLPDRDGHVTLDACIMNQHGECGSVVYLQNIVHPVSVARKVMEETPHVIMAGEGAEQFAYEQGFPKTNLLTEQSKKAWEKWKKQSEYKPVINIENHDTIGMLAIDRSGDISGACTTSGLAYKMNGRVGDSPIIGSGLFVDNQVGGAVATGMGEEVIKTVGSFLIVELMRQGKSPQEACEEAVRRIVDKPNSNYKDVQVAYAALNKEGEAGYYAIHENFGITRYQNGKNEYLKSEFVVPSRKK